jgi:hypothetical protein
VEKLLGELRKADSSNIELSTNAHYDVEKLATATDKATTPS